MSKQEDKQEQRVRALMEFIGTAIKEEMKASGIAGCAHIILSVKCVDNNRETIATHAMYMIHGLKISEYLQTFEPTCDRIFEAFTGEMRK